MSTAALSLTRVSRGTTRCRPTQREAGPREPRVRQDLHRPHGRRRPGRPTGAGTTRKVRPYGPLQLDPAAAVLHYAQEIFEGMKAYRHADGSVWTFRPEANAARFAALGPPAGAARAARGGLHRVAARARRTSTRRGCRPGTAARRASTCGRSCSPPRPSSACGRPREVTYCVIASPAGAYFAGGLKPVTLWLSTDYARAARRRHRRRQVRRQLRRQPRRASSRRIDQRLRPGGLPRRRRRTR